MNSRDQWTPRRKCLRQSSARERDNSKNRSSGRRLLLDGSARDAPAPPIDSCVPRRSGDPDARYVRLAKQRLDLASMSILPMSALHRRGNTALTRMVTSLR